MTMKRYSFFGGLHYYSIHCKGEIVYQSVGNTAEEARGNLPPEYRDCPNFTW